MNSNQIIKLIEVCISDSRSVDAASTYLKINEDPLLSTIKVLNTLKKEVKNNPQKVNVRILRAMHDVGMSSYKEFESTPLENSLTNLISLLAREIPGYNDLQPLRKDFGNGDPV